MKQEQTSSSVTVAQQLAHGIVNARPEKEALGQQVGQRLITDVLGICIAARHEFYVKAALSSFEQEGIARCSVSSKSVVLKAPPL